MKIPSIPGAFSGIGESGIKAAGSPLFPSEGDAALFDGPATGPLDDGPATGPPDDGPATGSLVDGPATGTPLSRLKAGDVEPDGGRKTGISNPRPEAAAAMVTCVGGKRSAASGLTNLCKIENHFKNLYA